MTPTSAGCFADDFNRLVNQVTVNYDRLAEQYKMYRRPDPGIAKAIWPHLAGARRVLNVGAGIGSYEPGDCEVIAVEPSEEMIALRSSATWRAVRGRKSTAVCSACRA